MVYVQLETTVNHHKESAGIKHYSTSSDVSGSGESWRSELLLVARELLSSRRADGGVVGLSLGAVVGGELLAVVGVHLLLGDHHRLAVHRQDDRPHEVYDHVQQRKGSVSLVRSIRTCAIHCSANINYRTRETH